jgi:type IV pilus assembly protein PilE
MMPRTVGGFTLLEMMIVVAIVAILAAIALPSYAAYVQRSRILDAVTRLSDARSRMEDYFLDERVYVDASGRCGFLPSTSATDAFIVQCEATATTFSVTATGVAAKGMTDFVYAIDQSGAKSTRAVPRGWSRSADCWTIRQDGFCV